MATSLWCRFGASVLTLATLILLTLPSQAQQRTTGVQIAETPPLPLNPSAEVVERAARAISAERNGGGIACTDDNFIETTATFFAGHTAGGQELGQSITSPCDGFLTDFFFVYQDDVAPAGDAFSGNLLVFDGAGTGGTQLATIPFAATNPDGFADFLGFSFADGLPVTQGQVLTFFPDMVAGTTGLQGADTDPLADGDLYVTTDGDPANAFAAPPNDLFIFAFFSAPAETVSQTVFDGPGWRLITPPVQFMIVDDFAGMNLVQGVPAGTSTPAQYPSAAPNFFTLYDGTTPYLAATATDEGILPGQGSFWYWYDNNAGPFSGGTSQSFELSSFVLAATGSPRTSDVGINYPVSADDFYMIGNPFADPFDVNGISVENMSGTVTLSSVFSAYDPSTGSYVSLMTNGRGDGDFAAPWQGLFAEVTANPGVEDPEFLMAIAEVNTAATPPFYGRTAQARSYPHIQLLLNGVTTSGTAVTDHAAHVRFLPDAVTGFGRHDGSKMAPPQAIHALLAPVGERDGAPYRLSVHSLPDNLTEAATIPVAFRATEGGDFSIAWNGADVLPEGWSATLRDTETGAVVDLQAEASYAFSAEATDWADRFVMTINPVSVVANEGGDGLPASYALHGAYPNPFAATTTLRFDVPTASAVTIEVLDVLGRRVAVLEDGPVEAGQHRVDWNVQEAASGLYLIQMRADGFVQTRRVTVLK
ncbi:MAG: T9SS type A sorting domain-containing protein [Rhodothermaceae bacterium]|nr:T9SS type A sorting domain-containing protein [Rhodothermaceae bacterium]